MTHAEIIAAIADAVHEETDDESIEIGPDTTADQVPGWDSLAHVRIVLNVGLRVGTDIDISETYTAANVDQLASAVERALATKKVGS